MLRHAAERRASPACFAQDRGRGPRGQEHLMLLLVLQLGQGRLLCRAQRGLLPRLQQDGIPLLGWGGVGAGPH